MHANFDCYNLHAPRCRLEDERKKSETEQMRLTRLQARGYKGFDPESLSACHSPVLSPTSAVAAWGSEIDTNQQSDEPKPLLQDSEAVTSHTQGAVTDSAAVAAQASSHPVSSLFDPWLPVRLALSGALIHVCLQ